MATKNDVGFALGTQTYQDTATIELFDPETDEVYRTPSGDPVTITVYGQDSKRYKDVFNNQTNRRIQKAQRSGGRPNITAEQQEANALELLSKCVADWYGIGDSDGNALEANEKNARMLFEARPDIRDQVDTAIHSRKNFLTS